MVRRGVQSVVDGLAHNQSDAGSIPAPATNPPPVDSAVTVSAFQINDMIMFTLKMGDELLASGVAHVCQSDGHCWISHSGVEIDCVVEQTDDDPKKVGSYPDQKRFWWSGRVIGWR